MILKGRIKLDWVTSRHFASTVIHKLDHARTTLHMVDDKVYVHAVGTCGAPMSPNWLILLSNEDAHQWLCNMGELNHKYGNRAECNWCSKWGD